MSFFDRIPLPRRRPVVPADSVAKAIVRLGWPALTEQAVRDFQRGWALGPALAVDGDAGPKTIEALQMSLARLNAGQPTASRYFSFSECACKCRYSDCRRIWVERGLLKAADSVRGELFPRGLAPGSVCRCRKHNTDIYRARGQKPTDSQHTYGRAMDPPPTAGLVAARRLGVLSGLGYKDTPRGRVLTHFDVRHLATDGTNWTGSKLSDPAVFED